jgi:hypothetical protein
MSTMATKGGGFDLTSSIVLIFTMSVGEEAYRVSGMSEIDNIYIFMEFNILIKIINLVLEDT